MKVELKLNQKALSERQERLSKAQDCVDNAVLKRLALYTPVGLPRFKNSGKLLKSAEIYKQGGIRYTAPFSRKDYYANVNHTRSGNPRATRLWFETMKTNHKNEILKSAAEAAGGKVKK